MAESSPEARRAPWRCNHRLRPPPGRCRGKVHQRATLGYTGRRVLVSRNWSGKTLTDHRLDGRDWFRAVTAGMLDDDQVPNVADGKPAEKGRFVYVVARRRDQDVDSLAERILRSVAARQRARLALRAALGDPTRSLAPPRDNKSATHPKRPRPDEEAST